MKTSTVLNFIVLSMLFFFSTLFSLPIKAASVATDPKVVSTPITVAYYYGYRRGWGWRHPGYVCPRTCWRDGWGFWHCVRRC